MERPTVLVIDFGSQYSQLITRRLRETGVFSVLVPPDQAVASLGRDDLVGVILSGGPASVVDIDAPALSRGVLQREVPVLGICYGMQLLTRELGGRITQESSREYGATEVRVDRDDGLFAGAAGEQTVWMSHGDHVAAPPAGFEVMAHSDGGTIAAIGHRQRRIYALQFHPEVSHTQNGARILQNFVRDVCGVTSNWDQGSFVEDKIEQIRQQVGQRRVLCAVSGGVDSTVMATLVRRAVGDQLRAVFVDNGLLRHNESAEVQADLGELLGDDLVAVDAGARFLDGLKGVTDPEVKRKRIGHTFIEVFEETAKQHGPFQLLAQGTLYPDRIESMSVRGPSHVIKTHHNVGGLPERLGFELLEPLGELFKDEVRAVGSVLQVPDRLLGRHPFPGPGLAVRCLGEVTEERLRLLRGADAIFIEELRRAGQYDQIWQAGAVLLPLRTVGVMGDQRTYESVCALRAVTSRDAMTADWARIPPEVLARISNRIVREIQGINRVAYDVTSKPPGTIEWE